MEFETIILRFRDLVTENDITITKHRDMINAKGYVWWGWWKKGNEKIPFDEFSVLKGYVEDNPIYFYLMDSGQKKLYMAKCSEIKCALNDKILSPEKDYTPSYYNDENYYAWFKFEEIKECAIDVVRNFTYVQVDALFIEERSNYVQFYGKRIYNINELIQQNRTLWFIRQYDEKRDSDYEIKLLDANVVEPLNFSDKYYETGSNTLLWLSDLHFGAEDVFKVKMENETDVTLKMHLSNAYADFEKIGGLIITGDITSYGKKEGFIQTKDFITDINRDLIRELTSQNIIFCPGNHDFKRKNEKLGDGIPEKVSDNSDSVNAYREFYKSIHNLYPDEYMACGRKLLMLSGRTVEIVALNSLILQQYKDFEGHGFLSKKQLDHVAENMGWSKNTQTNSIRIVIMHHHYLPTCFVEEIDVNRASSVVYDADRLMRWLVKYDVKLLLHGHKHQSYIAKVGCFDNGAPEVAIDELKNVYVIGMGGTGAQNCENKFAILNFASHEIELRYFRIYSDNTEKDKCVQTIHIPI